MLLNMDQIVAATKLDAQGIVDAVARSGYKDKCNSATYLGMTPNGSFVYEIGFTDLHSGDDLTCKIYVSYKKDYAGKINLYADF